VSAGLAAIGEAQRGSGRRAAALAARLRERVEPLRAARSAYAKMGQRQPRREGAPAPAAGPERGDADRHRIDAAFANNQDEMAGRQAHFRALMSRIVETAPAPADPEPTARERPAPAAGPLLLEVRDLSSHYGRIAALRGVDLAVGKGQLVALVGANGAGKTTLLRTVSGVQRASGGRVHFDGQDITRLRADKRVRLGICHVPEGRQVFGPLSVADNLRLGAYTGSDRKRIAQDLERMYAMFPVLAQRPTYRPAHSPAVSSRCWRSRAR